MPTLMPRELAMGFEGGPVFGTSVVSLSAGRRRRVSSRTRPVHEYTFTFSNKEKAYLLALKTFFIESRGQGELILFYDHLDNQLEDENLGVWTEPSPLTSPPTYPINLTKTYGTTNPWVRPIKYIDQTSLVAKVNGSPVGASFSNGVLTFDSDPGVGNTVTVSCTFYVPGHFTSDRFAASITFPRGEGGSVNGLGFVEDLDA